MSTRRAVPRPVELHHPALHPLAAPRVPHETHPPVECRQQVQGFGRRGDDAASVIRIPIDVGDGVDQAADSGDHRDRPVAHGLHLCEAARLEPARHHVQVGPGEQQPRELVVVALDERQVSGERCGQPVQLPRLCCVARPQDRELQGELVEDRNDRRQQIDALLVGEPRDHRCKRDAVVWSPETIEQRGAARGACGQAPVVERCRQPGIVRRVP